VGTLEQGTTSTRFILYRVAGGDGAALAPVASHQMEHRQGLTLVHFPAQPEAFLVTEATARVHFSAQPETFLSSKTPNIAHQRCSRLAEKWAHVAHKKRLG
jgi:hypothetical protein